MKLHTSKVSVQNPLTLSFSQKDPWVLQLIQDLGGAKAPSTSVLQGNITIRTDVAGFYHLTGAVQTSVILPCDICCDEFECPLHGEIRAVFRPSYEGNVPADMELKNDDLEVYFIGSEKTLDLEQLIRDTLYLVLPSALRCNKASCQ